MCASEPVVRTGGPVAGVKLVIEAIGTDDLEPTPGRYSDVTARTAAIAGPGDIECGCGDETIVGDKGGEDGTVISGAFARQ